MPEDHRFQVNLQGVIDLLSQHLYSSPQVYIRELLQNAVDAVVARQQREPAAEGEITLELTEGERPTLCVIDNGIGLTSEEVHRFLATIGQSSKRESMAPMDFIGQFGIGVLSAFVVSEEIVVITRSIDLKQRAVEWRGRADGTYSIRELDRDMAPGTQVYLTAKPGAEEYFEPELVRNRARHFGSLLPHRIEVITADERSVITETPPWRVEHETSAERDEAILEYGEQLFGSKFFDYIPLESAAGDVDGVAFVLPFSGRLAAKRTHRVYVKRMLLSDQAENLLPEWAFFVKCVVNANALRPTASRESFYEDRTLNEARRSLGACLRNYLVQLGQEDRPRLQALIRLHYLALKALAVEDDEFFQLFAEWLPMETSLGTMTLGEIRELTKRVLFVPDADQFRQISAVAAAQSICVVNGGYTYDTELIGKLPDIDPMIEVEQLDISLMSQSFGELTLPERDKVLSLVHIADEALRPFHCQVEVKKFSPHGLATLFTANRSATFLRSIEQSQDVANEVWSGVLASIAADATDHAHSQLCLNYNNKLIRQLAGVRDAELVRRSIEMLYVQALLMGHYPMRANELALMSDGLLGLVLHAINSAASSGDDADQDPEGSSRA
ncbi:MAG: HSP90 family protein [Planctomycetales bacterium]|nr:HSP90 family protein [Planctomycetales bacterium]